MAKRIYFISDAHLGSRALSDPKAHERRLCDFLTGIMYDARAVYMLGDMFDFWFEYHNVVPKGSTRFLGKLSELADRGVELHYFTGNHDIWAFDYLERECGVVIHRGPQVIELERDAVGSQGLAAPMRVYLAHGDGLGDESRSFRFIRAVFHSRLCQWLFRNLVPADLGVEFGLRWATQSRLRHTFGGVITNEFGDVLATHISHEEPFKGEDREELVLYAKEHLAEHPEIDAYIFGHRHIELDLMLAKDKRLIILGEWMNLCTYAEWDGACLSLNSLEEQS